jgi:hypothetical protein
MREDAAQRGDRVFAPHRFGNDPGDCFQLANHDREHRRRYDHYLLNPPKDPPAMAGCCFRGGGNQVMRNVALARTLLARGAAATVTVALAAPEAHHYIWRRWTEYHDLFSSSDGLRFADLPASTVLQLHPRAQAEQLAARYLVELEAKTTR